HLKILNPDGTVLTGADTATCGPSAFIEPVTLPIAGTYSVVIDPAGSGTGTIDVNLYDVVDFTAVITAGGPAVSAPVTVPGQNASLAFKGLTGHRVSVVTAMAGTACMPYTVSVRQSDSTPPLASVYGCGTTFLEPVSLPISGTFRVFVDPVGSTTAAFSVNLYDVVDASGSIAVGGAAVPLDLTVPGQNGILSFDGTAGHRISVLATTSGFACLAMPLTIKGPDGVPLATTYGCGTTFLEPVTLPAPGLYSVVVDPSGPTTRSTSIQVYDVVDVTGAIEINQQGMLVNLTAPGQNAALTFNASAGQSVTVVATMTNFSCLAYPLAIQKSDGTIVGRTWGCGTTVLGP